MPVNIDDVRDFILDRAITNNPATYKELGDALGFHWRDRSLNRILGEISRESYQKLSILLTAFIGHKPATKHGIILPGDGFNELSQEIAGMVILDFPKYRQHIQDVLCNLP
jgi:hypothetical protein